MLEFREYPIKNEDVIRHLQEPRTMKLLANVYLGKEECKRHVEFFNIMSKGRLNLGIPSKIFRWSSSDFLEDIDGIDVKLSKIIDPLFDKVSRESSPNFNPNNAIFRHHYCFNVLVPRAIIGCIQRRYRWPFDKAEWFFEAQQNRVGGREMEDFADEIQEDIRQERIRRSQEFLGLSSPREESEGLDLGADLPDVEETPESDFEPSSTSGKLETSEGEKVRPHYIPLFHYPPSCLQLVH